MTEWKIAVKGYYPGELQHMSVSTAETIPQTFHTCDYDTVTVGVSMTDSISRQKKTSSIHNPLRNPNATEELADSEPYFRGHIPGQQLDDKRVDRGEIPREGFLVKPSKAIHDLGDDRCPGGDVLRLCVATKLVVVLKDTDTEATNENKHLACVALRSHSREKALRDLRPCSLMLRSRVIVHPAKNVNQGSSAARLLLEQVR
jgi:hypothetical protein